MPLGTKVGDGYIAVKPVLDKTELAKAQAEARAAFQKSINDQLGFQKTANNQFLEASRKLNTQKDKDQAASGKRQLDSLKSSIAAQVSLEAQKNKALKVADDARLKSQVDGERAASRARVDLERDAKSLLGKLEGAGKGDDISGGFGKGISSFNSGFAALGNVGSVIGPLVQTSAAIAAIGLAIGAVMAVLPAFTAALVALPAAIGGVVVIAGLLKVALSGVSDAWSALDTSQKNAGKDAVAQAAAQVNATQAIQNAKRSLATATRQIISAHEDEVKAQKDVLKAQEAVNQSYVDAANNLADLDLRQKRNQFNLLDAQDAQVQAQRGLINAQSRNDPVLIAQAQRALDEANQTLAEQRQQIKENTEENDKAVAKGVNGSDQVVNALQAQKDAQEAYRDSIQKVIDTQQTLKDRQFDLAQAQRDYNLLLKNGSTDAQNLKSALDALSPSARKIVTSLHDVLGPNSAFTNTIQEAFFGPLSGLGDKIKGFVKDLTKPLSDIATQIGQSLSDIVSSFLGADGGQAVKDFLGGIKDFIKAATPGLSEFAKDLSTFLGKSGKFGDAFGTLFGKVLDGLGKFIDGIDIQKIVDALQPLLDAAPGLFDDVVSIFKSIFDAGSKVDFIGTFKKFFDSLAHFMETHPKDMQAFFELINNLNADTLQIILKTFEFVVENAQGFTNALKDLEDFSKWLAHIGEVTEDFFVFTLPDAVTSAFQGIKGAFSEVLNYLAPKLNAFIDLYDKLANIVPGLPTIPRLGGFGGKGFAGGGYTGNGGTNDLAGVVHGQEYVLPQSMSALFPTMEALRTGKSAPSLGGGDTYVTVMIDGQEFKGMVKTEIDVHDKKLGKQLQGK